MIRLTVLLPLALLVCACASTPSASISALRDARSDALGPYSQAIEANGFVFVSGVIAFNSQTNEFAPAEIDAQTRQCLENLRSILESNGLSLADVVKTTVFLRNAADMAGMNAAYSLYFHTRPPARTTVPGADWGRPDILIEIEAIALRR